MVEASISDAAFADMDGQIGSIAKPFAGRKVWGSDWPHTSFADALPAYESMLKPLS